MNLLANIKNTRHQQSMGSSMELMVKKITRKMGGGKSYPDSIGRCSGAQREQPFTALNMAVFTFFSHNWLVVWNHGMDSDFPETVGNFHPSQLTNSLHHFSEG